MSDVRVTKEYINRIDDIEELRRLCLYLLDKLEGPAEGGTTKGGDGTGDGAGKGVSIDGQKDAELSALMAEIEALEPKARELSLASEHEALLKAAAMGIHPAKIKKMMLDLRMAIKERERLETARRQIEKWKAMGYNVADLESMLKAKDIHGLGVAMEEYKHAINRIERIKEGLKNLKIRVEDMGEVDTILALMKEPSMVAEIELRFNALLKKQSLSEVKNGVPEDLQACTIDSFVVGDNAPLIKIIKQVLNREVDVSPIYIFGGSGVGKSHLLAAIVHEAEGLGERAIYVPFANLSALSQYRNYSVISIDDLDITHTQALRALISVLDWAKDAECRVFIAAELAPDELIQRVGDERLTSRILQGGTVEVKAIPMDKFRDMASKMTSHYGVDLGAENMELILTSTYPSPSRLKKVIRRVLNIIALKGSVTADDIKRAVRRE